MVAAAEPRTGKERMLFALSLVVFGTCCFWSAIVLFARIYPALFPGRDLISDVNAVGVISNVTKPLPGIIQVPQTNPTSVFNRRINVLVLGVDKRPDEDDLGDYRTDTIMVATVDPLSKQASVLSIPRDAYITINHPAGYTYEDRINASYGVGFENGHSFDAGAKQLEKDIKANFGIDIDYWVLMDFKGVEQLINVLDGIDVDIPPELAVGDWYYSDDDYSGRWISFPEGMQHLDGYHAVAFGRNRESEHGDLDRMLRQQLVLQTAVNKIFSQKLLDDPVGLYNAYGNIVKSDIPANRILALGLLAKETSGNLATYSLGAEVNGVPTVEDFTTPEGAAVLMLNPENVSTILATMFTKATYAGSRVEIQDGIGGLAGEDKAAALGRYLRFTKQLPTVYESGEVLSQDETTITVYDPRWAPLAQEIALWLGVPIASIVSEEKPRGSALPDIIVTIGESYRAPG